MMQLFFSKLAWTMPKCKRVAEFSGRGRTLPAPVAHSNLTEKQQHHAAKSHTTNLESVIEDGLKTRCTGVCYKG